MKRVLNQSRTAINTERSKCLYFFIHIFHLLFRSKHDVRINSLFCYLGDLSCYEYRNTAGNNHKDRTDQHDGQVVTELSHNGPRLSYFPYLIERTFNTS